MGTTIVLNLKIMRVRQTDLTCPHLLRWKVVSDALSCATAWLELGKKIQRADFLVIY